MEKQSNYYQVDPDLLFGWLGARSIARGLPLPVPDRGGLRVDTGLPTEIRRYVFAAAVPAIRALAESVNVPHVAIKLCGSGEDLQALVPSRWQLQPAGWLMTHAAARDEAPLPLPAGYRIETLHTHPATVVRIFAEDGALAASGYAVEYGGVFVFDRILTEAAHQRCGLGRALMAALGAAQQSSAVRRVLVATDAGRALYLALGWTVRSPYSTVLISSPKAAPDTVSS